MENDETIDGLPILKKTPPTTDEGLPIFAKKKDLPNSNAGKSSTVPLNNGLNNFLSFPQSISYAPVTDPTLRQEIRNSDIEATNQQAQAQQQSDVAFRGAIKSGEILNNIKSFGKQRDARIKALQDPSTAAPILEQEAQQKKEQEDALNSAAKKVDDSEKSRLNKKYGDSFWGNIGAASEFLGSKLQKGAVNSVDQLLTAGDKIRTTLGGEPMTDYEKSLYKGDVNQLNEKAQGEVTPGYEGSNKFSRAVGGLTEALPSLVTGGLTGGSTFYLEQLGQGAKDMQEAKDRGLNINPITENAYIFGKSIIGGKLMNSLNTHTLFPTLPSAFRNAVVDKASVEVMNDLLKSGEKVTVEDFSKAFIDKATTLGERIKTGGLPFLKEAAKGYVKTGADLTALNASDAIEKLAVNKAEDKNVFDVDPEQLGESLKRVWTEDAPLFGAIGAIRGSGGILFDKSPFKSGVVESLRDNNSPENVQHIKDALQNGVEGGDIQPTLDYVDRLSQSVAKLPKGIIPEHKFNDAVDLVTNRDNLQAELKQTKEANGSVDPAFEGIKTPQEQLLEDKIEQANDKLKDIATGLKTTYSKGTGEDEGKFFKTVGGKKEEITESRYDLENTERESRIEPNETIQPEANKINENNVPETPQADETGVPPSTDTKPIEQNPISDEQRKAQNEETDAKVKAFQEKFPDRKVDPLEDLPESVVRTFDRVDADLPTDPVSVNEASDWLYNKYKQLTAMKASDTRLLTTEQIDAMQQQLGEDITMLENHKLKYHGENEAVPSGDTAKAEPTTTEVQPTEQAIASPDQVAGDIAGQTQKPIEINPPPIEVTKTNNNEPTNTGATEPVTSEVQQPEITAPKVEETKAEVPTGDKEVSEPKPKVENTAAKNAATDAIADELGVDLKYSKGEVRSRDIVEAEADKFLKEGGNPKDIIEKIINDKHEASDTENVVVAKYLGGIKNKLSEINEKLKEKAATMSKSEFDSLNNENEQLLNDFQEGAAALKATRTAIARSLNSGNFSVKNSFDLADMITRKRQANGGQKLTPEQVSDVNKRFQEIDEVNKKLQARIDKLETDAAKEKTARTIKRIKDGEARIQRKAVTKEALAEDRKKIAADFSAKLKEMRQPGSFNSAGKATFEFLQAAAPYVAKMVRNLALEGVTEIKDVVARVKEELDLNDLSDREVTDMIGGVYNEKKGTRSELEAQVRDLKTQARLLSEIEDAEAGISKAKKPMPKASAKVEELRKRLEELQKGTPPSKEETSLKQSKTAIQKRIAELERRITEKDFSKPEPNETKPDQELLDLRRKADRLKDEYGLQLAKDELANRTKIEKLKDDLLNIGSLPRALKASLDFSAVLRQGLFLAPHLKESGNALKEMFGQTFSEEKYKNWISDLKHTPMYDLMQKSDLYLSDKNNHKLLAKEEEFTSNLAEKIPIIGPAIEASERAYTSYLNVLRAGVFTSEAQKLIERGYTFENNPKEFQSLAKVVNVLSGRGDIPEFLGGKQPKILSTALFSPRFMAARLQTLYLWADPRLTKNARILAAKDIGKTLASAGVLLTMASLAGYTVVHDPRSVNFLKIQDKQEKGTTYYDIVGGLAQYVRFLAQQLSGQKIPINGKGVVTFGTKKARNTTRLTEAARFMRGKLSPLVGGAFNLMEGKDVVGQPYHLWPNVPQEFVPLPYTDVKEAYDVGGITNGLKALLPSQFGIGTSSYDPNKKTKK